MATAAPAVEFRDVKKRFGAQAAVDGITLTVHVGEMVALLGPNGAGKTTCVAMMLGLRQPSSGTVRVFGGDAAAAVHAGRVAAMLQSGGLPPGLRVIELVDFVRRLYPRPLTLNDALKTAGCEGFAGSRLERLSGGQQQRVRFALAIAGSPELLFLDEPTTGFDVDTRRLFWQSVRSLATRGSTVLFATHYLDEADAAADRIIVLQRGAVVADGTAGEIKARVGGRSLRFTWQGAGRDALMRLEGVTQADLQGDTVRLRTSDTDATVRALVHGSIPFRDLEIGGADLEEAFLSLVHAHATAEEGVSR